MNKQFLEMETIHTLKCCFNQIVIINIYSNAAQTTYMQHKSIRKRRIRLKTTHFSSFQPSNWEVVFKWNYISSNFAVQEMLSSTILRMDHQTCFKPNLLQNFVFKKIHVRC